MSTRKVKEKTVNWVEVAIEAILRRLAMEHQLAEVRAMNTALQNELNSVRTRAGLKNLPHENYEHFRSYISRLETELKVTKEAFLSRPKPSDIDALELKIDELKMSLATAEIDAWRWRRVVTMLSEPQIVGYIDKAAGISLTYAYNLTSLPIYEWRFRAVGEKDFEKSVDKSIDKSKKDPPHAFNRKILD